MRVAVQHDRRNKVRQRPRNMPCELQRSMTAASSNVKMDRQLAHGESMMVNANCTQGDPNTQYNNTAFNTYCTVQPCQIQVNEDFAITATGHEKKIPSFSGFLI